MGQAGLVNDFNIAVILIEPDALVVFTMNIQTYNRPFSVAHYPIDKQWHASTSPDNNTTAAAISADITSADRIKPPCLIITG